MELFSIPWWSALGAIILMDLVLAGDNALVIGMAASKLRPDLRRKAIVFGALGAIVVRGAMALIVVWLLKIPGLQLAGGLLLLPIAWKLARPSGGHDSDHDDGQAATSFWGAMKTIVIADALMGVDNVLAIGGAAHGRWDLVILGLLFTIPLIVWGSTWVARAIERWPLIIALGAGVLAVTGVGMIVKDPLFDTYVFNNVTYDRILQVLAFVVMFYVGWRALNGSRKRNDEEADEARA
ncbi:MAG: TerC family protein [Burkholderiaceae bacterium]